LLGLILLACQAGCGTIEGLSNPKDDSLILIGVRRDVAHISGEAHVGNSCMDITDLLIPFYIIDFPISLALDLVLLPVTIPSGLWRGDDSEENVKQLQEER